MEPLLDAESLCSPWLGLPEEPGGGQWPLKPQASPHLSVPESHDHTPLSSGVPRKHEEKGHSIGHCSHGTEPGSQASSLRPDSSKQWGCRHQVGLAPGPPRPQEQECLLLPSPSPWAPAVGFTLSSPVSAPHPAGYSPEVEAGLGVLCDRWWTGPVPLKGVTSVPHPAPSWTGVNQHQCQRSGRRLSWWRWVATCLVLLPRAGAWSAAGVARPAELHPSRFTGG